MGPQNHLPALIPKGNHWSTHVEQLPVSTAGSCPRADAGFCFTKPLCCSPSLWGARALRTACLRWNATVFLLSLHELLENGRFLSSAFSNFHDFLCEYGKGMPRVCPACRVPQLLPRVQAEHSWGQVVYSKFLAPATSVSGFC